MAQGCSRRPHKPCQQQVAQQAEASSNNAGTSHLFSMVPLALAALLIVSAIIGDSSSLTTHHKMSLANSRLSSLCSNFAGVWEAATSHPLMAQMPLAPAQAVASVLCLAIIGTAKLCIVSVSYLKGVMPSSSPVQTKLDQALPGRQPCELSGDCQKYTYWDMAFDMVTHVAVLLSATAIYTWWFWTVYMRDWSCLYALPIVAGVMLAGETLDAKRAVRVCTHIFCFAMVVAGTEAAYTTARREGRDPPLRRVLLLPSTCLIYLLALAGVRLSLEHEEVRQQNIKTEKRHGRAWRSERAANTGPKSSFVTTAEVMCVVLPAVLGVAAAALVILPDSWEAIAHSFCTQALAFMLLAWEACSRSLLALAAPAVKYAAALPATVASVWVDVLAVATTALMQVTSAAQHNFWAATAFQCLPALLLAKMCALYVRHQKVVGSVLPAVLGVAAAVLVIMQYSWEAVACSFCTHALTLTLPSWEACSSSLLALTQPGLERAAALLATGASVWSNVLGMGNAALVQLKTEAGTNIWAETAVECLAVLLLAKLCTLYVDHYKRGVTQCSAQAMHAALSYDSNVGTNAAIHGQSAKLKSAASGQQPKTGGSVHSKRSLSPHAASSKASGHSSPSQKLYGKTAEKVVSEFAAKGTDKNAGDFTIGSSVHSNASAHNRIVPARLETGKGGGAQEGADISKTKGRSNSPAVDAVRHESSPAPVAQKMIGDITSANAEAGRSSPVGKKRVKKNQSARKKRGAQADAADGGGWRKVEKMSNARKATAPGTQPLCHGSYKSVLEALLRKVFRGGLVQRQSCISLLTQLYCSVPMKYITAYGIYTSGATATKGFALLDEVVSNRLGLSLEEQLLVCGKPGVWDSIELFLRALVAHQYNQQLAALAPVLATACPNEHRRGNSKLVGDTVEKWVLPLQHAQVPAVVHQQGLQLLAQLLSL